MSELGNIVIKNIKSNEEFEELCSILANGLRNNAKGHKFFTERQMTEDVGTPSLEEVKFFVWDGVTNIKSPLEPIYLNTIDNSSDGFNSEPSSKILSTDIQEEVRDMFDDFLYRTRTQDVKTLDEQGELIVNVIDDFVDLLDDRDWTIPDDSLEELCEYIEMSVMNEVVEIHGELKE